MDDVMDNSTTEITNYAPFITNMVSAKMIRLTYRSERIGDWTVKQTQQYELGIIRYFQQYVLFLTLFSAAVEEIIYKEMLG